jgi:hypothetical protein
MKKIIVQTAVVLLLISSAFAQAKGIETLPKEVSNAFLKKYPAARFKKWDLKDNDYVLKYADNKKIHFTWFSADGIWLKTETKHHFTYSMPDAVKSGWKKSGFILWDIENIKEVETPYLHQFVMTVVDIHSYDLENRGSQRKFELTFALNGKLLKKQEMHDAF